MLYKSDLHKDSSLSDEKFYGRQIAKDLVHNDEEESSNPKQLKHTVHIQEPQWSILAVLLVALVIRGVIPICLYVHCILE